MVDERAENLVDVDIALSGALEEGAAVALGQFLAFSCVHFTLLVQIALVANEYHRNVGRVLVTDDTLADGV